MAWRLKKTSGASETEAWTIVFDGDAAGGMAGVYALPAAQGGLPGIQEGAGAGENATPASPDGTPDQHAVAATPGADVFVLDRTTLVTATAPQPSVAQIADYRSTQGDIIDFSGVLSASYAPLSAENVELRVTADESPNSATLEFNIGNPGHPFWLAVAELNGVHTGDTVTVSLDATHTVHLSVAWLA